MYNYSKFVWFMQKNVLLCKYIRRIDVDKESVIVDLHEKNIGVEGEEFYAVIGAYIDKINELNGKKTELPITLLKLASKYEVSGSEEDKKAFEKEFGDFLKKQKAEVKQVCESSQTNKEKVEALHKIAIEYGVKRSYQETVSRCRTFTVVNELLEHEKASYVENYQNYLALRGIKYDEKALEEMIRKRAGNVQTSIETIKSTIKGNIDSEEDKFLLAQIKFVGRTVGLIVDDRCRILNCQADFEEGQAS